MRFFVNTGDGVEYVDTQEQAIARANQAIDDWRDCCDPEWPEEVEEVCWGAILGESNCVRSGEDVECDTGIEHAEYATYELTEPPKQWRCNLCGGLVSFDGTAPRFDA